MADSHQMFINGEWVNSSDGGTRDVINPATGEVIASVQEGTAEDANRAVAAAEKPPSTATGTTPRRRTGSSALLKLADAIEANAEEIVRLEARTSASRLAVTMSEEIPPIVDNLRFFAGAARTLEGRSAGEYMAGFTSDHPPRADRRGRPDRPVELPAHDGDLEDRPGARDRQHDRAEAVRAHAADGASSWPSSPPTSSPPACST